MINKCNIYFLGIYGELEFERFELEFDFVLNHLGI